MRETTSSALFSDSVLAKHLSGLDPETKKAVAEALDRFCDGAEYLLIVAIHGKKSPQAERYRRRHPAWRQNAQLAKKIWKA